MFEPCILKLFVKEPCWLEAGILKLFMLKLLK